MIEIREFYRHLLGLAGPWKVAAVVSEDGSEKVDVHLECTDATQLPCPRCNRYCPVCDHSPLGSWRHLDTCGKTTWLHARVPIVDCPEHGRQSPPFPWGEPESPVTPAFERMLATLAEGFGDTRKAARFAGMEPARLRRILRRTREAVEKTVCGPADSGGASLPASPGPRARQLSVFEQNDLTFVNQGIQAFRSLDLEKAIDLFEKHRVVYPRGFDVTSRLAAARFLIQGFAEAPADASERPAYLFRLWDSFEDFTASGGAGGKRYDAEVKGAFFARMVEEAERHSPADPSFLPGDIPLGCVLLRAGRIEEAIRSLQNCIPKAPHNAALYGVLGDAYLLRGEQSIARQCYREACFIDPAGIDWRHMQDEDLKELKQDLLLEYGLDPEAAVQWLPCHARIEGLFERKVVRLHEGLKEIVDDYLALQKALAKEKDPRLKAKLFLRGMVLCENPESLKFIKKIDLIQVRRMMKEANPDLFADFLERIVEGKG